MGIQAAPEIKYALILEAVMQERKSAQNQQDV